MPLIGQLTATRPSKNFLPLVIITREALGDVYRNEREEDDNRRDDVHNACLVGPGHFFENPEWESVNSRRSGEDGDVNLIETQGKSEESPGKE